MDIYSPKGTKVIVTEQSAKNGWQADKDRIAGYEMVGKEFTVEKTIVDRFSTTVFLQEYPNIPFNSVNFENVKV